MRFFYRNFYQYFLVCICLSFFLFCGGGLFAQDSNDNELLKIPKLKSRVTDLTGTLSRGQQAELEVILRSFQEKKGAEVALLILSSTKPETIETFGIRLADKWKVGRKKIDDGAILIVAKNDRRLRIEVGYGLESSLTDIMSDQIIRTIITPYFKRGDFYQGIKNGLLAMTKVYRWRGATRLSGQIVVFTKKIWFTKTLGRRSHFIPYSFCNCWFFN